MTNSDNTEGIITGENTPGILASAMAAETPEIEYAAEVVPSSWFGKVTLSVGDNTNVRASGQFVGKDYLNIFSFPLIQGDKNQVLADKSSIVISKDLARRLFNTTENVIGKTITWQHEKEYIVSGVLENTPSNSSAQFDYLLSYEIFLEKFPNFKEWWNSGPSTYVLLKEGTLVATFNKKIEDFIKRKIEWAKTTLFVRPYTEAYLYSKYENGRQVGGRIEYVKLFSIIAVFILFIACINFMNLSTAKASRRVKEVGIKKAMGAARSTLIFRYLGESLLIAFCSLLMAILLVVILLPQFNQITGKNLALHFNTGVVLTALGVTLFTGIISGSYPALFLSGFNPAAILKGKLASSVSEIWARKGLVVFQFMLSIILIVAVWVVYKQIDFIQTKNLGYNKDNIIVFKKEGAVSQNIGTFLNEVRDIPGVVTTSSMKGNIIDEFGTTTNLEWEGKKPDDMISFGTVGVNYGMIETLGIELAAGRSFSSSISSDSSEIIFNEAAIQTMGLKDPIGKVVKMWDKNRTIVGIAKNFHGKSFHENVKPFVIRLEPRNNGSDRIMIKIAAGRERETIEQLQKFYQAYNPGFSLDYKFLEQDYQALYVAEMRVSILSRYFAGLAIIISCLGLFGLAAFTAERRLKEIGIRKALGSTELGIVYLLSGDFTKIVLVSIVIALPLSYLVIQYWLNSFAYRIEVKLWYFLGAGFMALCIAWFTVGLQAIRAARVNPSKCLRD